MTNGQPLIVRGAMKPLPTLTKPLRSVDIATHEPAEALRERTDSCTVPAAGVVGEAMVALVLADAYRQKFGGDHIDDVLAGRARLQREDRVALVLIGFMGAGKSTLAARLAQALGRGPLDSDALLDERFGHLDRPRVRAPRRGVVPSGRGASSCVGCWPTPARARWSRSVAAASCPSAVRDALAATSTLLLDVDPDVAWERVRAEMRLATGSDRSAGARLATRSPRAHAERQRAVREAGRSRVLLWAMLRLRGTTRCSSAAVCCGSWRRGAGWRALWPLDRSRSRPFLVTDETVSALYADRLGNLAGSIAIAPGEQPQDACERRARLARARSAPA